MHEKPDLHNAITRLLGSQLLAVLSTHHDGQPYANLVAYAYRDDLQQLYFATSRSTSKFVNIKQDSRVALLVHDSANKAEDFQAASALTIVGAATDLEGPVRTKAETVYLERHPSLQGFLHEPTTALLAVSVSRYILATRFQEVHEYFPGK